MVRGSLWRVLVLACVVWSSVGARAQGTMSTVYLREGGKVRGEIVIDIPNRPLTVQVGGQTLELARESIERIESDTTVPAAGLPPAAPVVVAPAVSPSPGLVAAPPQAPANTVLTVDRRGRAEIDSNWSPEVKTLVTRRNETTRQLARKGYTGPVIMLAVGGGAYLITLLASRLTLRLYEQCLEEKVEQSGDLGECSDSSVPLARAGYIMSSALVAGGSVFFWTRWWRKHRLQSERDQIDMNLRQFNVVPMATRERNGWVGGGALRVAF